MSHPDSSAGPRLPRGRHGLSPEQVAENQRWRLVGAAGEALLEHCYRDTNSRRVSERAGVSSATFYSHFDDVDACLQDAHGMAADALWELVSAACTGPGTWPERLRAALDIAAGFLSSEPSLARLLCTDVVVGVPAVATARGSLQRRLAGFLCSGRSMRLPTADRLGRQLETHLVAATVALLSDRIAAGEHRTLPALAAELAEIIAAPYRGGEAAG